MPIFEFKCMKCEKEFEYLVFNNSEKILCPECKKDKVKRLMSACSFKSQGGGGGGEETTQYSAPASSGCSGCSGGNCSTCH